MNSIYASISIYFNYDDKIKGNKIKETLKNVLNRDLKFYLII